ncbi:MAG: nuclear transport factor 2 family protein [Gaiellaceae bacterium]
MEPREVVAEFWARMQAHDWDGLRRLLADDFSVDWPDTRLRIRGAHKFVEFNREYPEGWTIEVRQIVAQDHTVVSEVRVPHTGRGVYHVVSILEVEGGRVVSGREYWLEEQASTVPPERARWFEQF